VRRGSQPSAQPRRSLVNQRQVRFPIAGSPGKERIFYQGTNRDAHHRLEQTLLQ